MSAKRQVIRLLFGVLVSALVVSTVLKVTIAQDTTADDPKAIVTQYYDEISNESDAVKAKAAIETLLDPQFEFYSPNNVDPVTGLLTHLAFLREERMSFPDLEWTVVEMIAEDNTVAVRWTLTG